MSQRIGVFVCGCGPEITERLDIEQVARDAKTQEGACISSTHALLCSSEGKEFLRAQIENENLDRVVVAACSPKEHEHTFRKVLEEAGLNPFLLQVVNIREQCAWVVNDYVRATEKGKRLVRAAIKRVKHHEEVRQERIEVNPDVLVVGSGVAGMAAALSLARAGRTVYLVERSPVIGGKVALYDEVFPMMECGSCILDPLMDSVLHDERIKLYTCATVKEVLGYFGNFHVVINKDARYVDADLCIGCGACSEACPIEVPNEYNQHLDTRRAIYIPYQGALPNVALIDYENCKRKQGQDCRACSEACPFNAVHYDDQCRNVEIRVGAIVVACGFTLPEAASESYMKIPGMLSGLAFERMVNSAGPTQGKLVTGRGLVPDHVVIIHCVESGQDEFYPCNSHLCSMLAQKQAKIIQQRWPSVSITHLFTELTVEGGFIKGIHDGDGTLENSSFIRIHPGEGVKIGQGQHELEVSCVDSIGLVHSIAANMVLVNFRPKAGESAKQLAEILDIGLDEGGFFREMDPIVSPLSTSRKGIWVAGGAKGPKDIQSSITEGKAAAGELLSTLIPGENIVIEPEAAWLNEELCSGCGICLSCCYYKAIMKEEETGRIILNRLLCMGCGTCAAACPSGAIESPLFTDAQLYGEIEGLFCLPAEAGK